MNDSARANGSHHPVVVVVVVTYHRPDELRRVIAALLAQTRPPDSIIVFDNGGPERASRILQDFAARLEIIHSEQNLGGAGGFARGLARGLARGADWVWLLDDDAIPEPDALANLLTVLPALPADTGALGCAVREHGDWAVRHRRLFCRWTGWESSLGRRDYAKPFVEMDTGSFVGFLVSTQAARQVDLPDADFFLAYDDTDYSLRLREASWRLFLVPGSVVNHLRGPASRLRSSTFGDKHYFNIRNRLIVKRRYARLRSLATLDGVAYALLLWLRASGWKSRDRRRLLWQALSDGLSGRLGAAPGQAMAAPRVPGNPAPHPEFPERPRGAVISRTQGRRPGLLAEALASVAAQTVPVTAFVVVHGEPQALESVRNAIHGIHPDVEILHAADTHRNRGYPLNLALERIYEAGNRFDFLFFLDDDDIVYPGFCATVTEVFRHLKADVVYAASNRKLPAGEVVPGYAPLPIACLLFENFIPINSYAIRLAAIRPARPHFDESLEVLEDWNFLHRLLALRLKFVPAAGTLSEFRLTGDGNTPDKHDQPMWDRAWDGVQRYLDPLYRDIDRDYMIAAFRNFDFDSRAPLTPPELRMVEKTRELLARRFPDACLVSGRLT